MEKSSKGKSKKQPKEEDKEDEFVKKMKKKAIVKEHGIDNIGTFEHPASFLSQQKFL